jgi:RHS repeat-associated protein
VLDGNGTPRTVNESLYGNPWTFTGRRLDGETGLMYFRNRMYETGLGRFCQRDPIGYADGWSLYTYVSSNPCVSMDPMGLWSWRLRSDHLQYNHCCKKLLRKSGQMYYYKSHMECYPDEEVSAEHCCKEQMRPKPICWCGPDITAELKNLGTRVEAVYSRWTAKQQSDACYTIRSLNPETLSKSWDIYPLRYSGVVSGSCPTLPTCKNTVEVFGVCMLHHEANYYLWGVIAKLCQGSKLWQGGNVGRASMWVWKFFGYGQTPSANTQWAFELGYGNRGRPTDVDDVNGCQVGGCGAYSQPFDWVWLPNQLKGP